MAQTYTYSDIGQRIMERNPDAFKGLNVTAEQVGQRVVQRNPDAFKGLLSDTGTKTQKSAPAAPTADQASQQKYGSTFGANTQNPSAFEPLKVVGNIPSSTIGFVGGAVDLLNPVSTVNKIASIPGAFSGLSSDLNAQHQSESLAAEGMNKVIQKYQQDKAAGKDTTRLESYLRQNGIDPTRASRQAAPAVTPRNDTFGSFMGALPGAAYESVVPEAGRAIVSAIHGGFTGNQAEVDKNLQTAQRAIINDPVGQILPFLAAAEGGAKALDRTGITTDASGALERGVSKVAKPVTTTFGKAGEVAKKAGGAAVDAAGKTTKFMLGQATGLNPDTISEIIKNPENFTKAAQGAMDRSSLGQEVQSALGQRAASLEETGKGYEPIRSLKAPNTEVSDATQKVINNAGTKYVYNMAEAPTEKLSIAELRQKANMMAKDTTGLYSKSDIGAVRDLIDKRVAAEPVPHTVKVNPTYLDRTIRENTGLRLKEGQLQTSGSAAIRDAKDVRALQTLYDTWKPVFEKGKMTTTEFLNFRADLAKLSKFEREISRSAPLEDLSKVMRKKFNDAHRGQIPGLAELDQSFSTQKAELRALSKGMVDKNGNLTDSALNKIANATGKGKDALLSRLEETVPGITEKIKTLKAIEDIQHASGIKVGTYGRVAGAALGFAGGGLPGALAEAILTSPNVAVPILRRYGLLKEGTAATAIISAIKKSGSAGKNVFGALNELPERQPAFMTKDMRQVKISNPFGRKQAVPTVAP